MLAWVVNITCMCLQRDSTTWGRRHFLTDLAKRCPSYLTINATRLKSKRSLCPEEQASFYTSQNTLCQTFHLRWSTTFTSDIYQVFTSIDFLPFQRSQYLEGIWNMCNKQIGFAILNTLKSLSTLIFKNKCMIRFADVPQPRRSERLSDGKTNNIIHNNDEEELYPQNKGRFKGNCDSRKTTTTIRLTLTDCFTQPTQTSSPPPGHSDVRSLPETDGESVHRRYTPRDRKPCCALGATFKKYNQSLLAVGPTMSEHIYQQLWLLWQNMRLPDFCGKYSYTVSLQYKTNQNWWLKRLKLHSGHPLCFPVLNHEMVYPQHWGKLVHAFKTAGRSPAHTWVLSWPVCEHGNIHRDYFKLRCTWSVMESEPVVFK